MYLNPSVFLLLPGSVLSSPSPQSLFAHGTAKIHARSEDTGMDDKHDSRNGVGGGRIGFGKKQVKEHSMALSNFMMVVAGYE